MTPGEAIEKIREITEHKYSFTPKPSIPRHWFSPYLMIDNRRIAYRIQRTRG